LRDYTKYEVAGEVDEPAAGLAHASGDRLGTGDVQHPRHAGIQLARFQGTVADRIEDGAKTMTAEQLCHAALVPGSQEVAPFMTLGSAQVGPDAISLAR
jgi:hypothetical protein